MTNRSERTSIQRWSEDVILVDLPQNLTKHGELQAVTAMLRAGCVCDVVVDFSRVQVVGGTLLTQLQKIKRLVHEGGHKLILCDVTPAMRGVFTIAHIDGLFEFADDRFTALASPRLVGQSDWSPRSVARGIRPVSIKSKVSPC
jgi:anti-anti-sigma regulatory factor